MLKAQDIRVVTFDKGMRGYNTEDVDAFLAQVADQVETMENEKAELEKKLYMLAEKVTEYRKDEAILKDALLEAQRASKNIIQEADRKAARVLQDADIKAKAITSQADQQLEVTKTDLARLQEEVGRFKNNILNLYRKHIESLSTLPDAPSRADAAQPQSEEPAAPAQA